MRGRVAYSLIFLLASFFARPEPAVAQTAETVIEWNQALNTTLSTPGASDPNVFFTRPIALLNVAIFDAINSFGRVYTPYLGVVDVAADASADAAAAQAARDVLVSMFPTQRAIYDALLTSQLSRVATGPAQRGAEAGAAVARAILQRRADDGWSRPPVSYVLPSLPGYWQPVPPQNAAATCALPGRRAFRDRESIPVHARGSARSYERALRRRLQPDQAIGSATSTTRTADQTLIARLFAVVGTTTNIPAVWLNLTRDLVRARAVNGLDAARLYALVGVTSHDALLTSFSGKFQYGMWRPVTAIREADRDENQAT